MSVTVTKAIAITLIVAGEIFFIAAEIFGARLYVASNGLLKVSLTVIPVGALGAALLVWGYMVGIGSFKNIWVVSAISITSVLVVEPILDYLIFQQMPTRGSLVGLIFGALGFVSTLFL